MRSRAKRFPHGDALGKRVTFDLGYAVDRRDCRHRRRVSARKQSGRGTGSRIVHVILANHAPSASTLVVRLSESTQDVLNAVRGATAGIDPDVAVFGVRTMKQQVSDLQAQPRLRSALLGVFSIVALILASLGVYGVIACSVAERRREIGIRIALGACPVEVRSMVLRSRTEAHRRRPCAGPDRRCRGDMLTPSVPVWRERRRDLLTYAGTCAVFIPVALLASYLPCPPGNAGRPHNGSARRVEARS